MLKLFVLYIGIGIAYHALLLILEDESDKDIANIQEHIFKKTGIWTTRKDIENILLPLAEAITSLFNISLWWLSMLILLWQFVVSKSDNE